MSAVSTKQKRNKFTNKDRYIALEYYNENKPINYYKCVLDLRKLHPDRYNASGKILNSETIRKWTKRYTGLELEKLRNKTGCRSKTKYFAKLAKLVMEEIEFRDENNLMRDIDTMRDWAADKALELIDEDDRYKEFKGSRRFIQDIIDEHFSVLSITGKSQLTMNEFIEARREWLEEERSWLIENDYVDQNFIDKDDKDNADEVPSCLKGKPKKQVKKPSVYTQTKKSFLKNRSQVKVKER